MASFAITRWDRPISGCQTHVSIARRNPNEARNQAHQTLGVEKARAGLGMDDARFGALAPDFSQFPATDVGELLRFQAVKHLKRNEATRHSQQEI